MKNIILLFALFVFGGCNSSPDKNVDDEDLE